MQTNLFGMATYHVEPQRNPNAKATAVELSDLVANADNTTALDHLFLYLSFNGKHYSNSDYERLCTAIYAGIERMKANLMNGKNQSHFDKPLPCIVYSHSDTLKR